MQIDLHTLVLILSLTNLVHVVSLFAQSRLNKTHQGLNFWWWGALAISIAFLLNYIRSDPKVGQVAIAANNVFFFTGMALFYVGFMRFFGLQEHTRGLVLAGLIFFAAISYLTITEDLPSRRFLISFAIAVFSFLISGVLFRQQTPYIAVSVRFLLVVFLVNGLFFTLRGLSVFSHLPSSDLFEASFLQITTYSIYLVVSMLWTFGIILMVNQRSTGENIKAREYAQLFFNHTPDAVLITRMSDGYFVEMNEGFYKLSGYTRTEVIGKTTLEVNIWKNPEDRADLLKILREKGVVENYEAVFQKKNGSEIIGIISVRLIQLDGHPHLLTMVRDVTESRKIEQEKELVTARLRMLSVAIDQSPLSIVITDLQGHIVSVNPKFTEVTGYQPEDAIGQNPRILKTGLKSKEEYTELWRTILAGQTWQGVFQNRKKNGDLYWESASISPVKDDSGGITHFLALKQDITERVMAEEELTETRALLNLLLETLPQNIYAKDADGRFIFANQQYCATEGRTREEILGRTDYDLHPAELAEKYRADDQRVIESGQTADIIETHQPIGKGKIYVQVIKTPFKYSRGKAPGILGIFWDITERRQAEEALRENQQFLSQLIENNGAIIFSKNIEGRYELVNKKWEEDVGIKREAAIGKTDAELFPLRMSEAHCQSDRQVIETRSIVQTEEIYHFDGGQRYYSTMKFPLFHNNGEVRGVCGITTDITERKISELALKESSEELENINRQLEDLITNANEMAAEAVRAEAVARENEEKFRELADLLPQTVFEVDAEGRLTFVNQQAYGIFGYSQNDRVVGRRIQNFFTEESRGKMLESLRGFAYKDLMRSNEYTMIRKDGSTFQALVYLNTIVRNGTTVGLRGIIVDITERKRLEEELHRQATTDSLTGIYNRRHFEKLAAAELKRAQRLNHPLSVAVIDIDYFKQVNDTYGHAAGDQVLLAFRNLCQSNIREIDVFARLGGDEFALLLPVSTCDQAFAALERIRDAVEAEPIRLGEIHVSITVSVGLASLIEKDEDFDKLLIKADQALYQSKQAGRNKVTRCDPRGNPL